jgi:hypothetical protein
MLKLSLSDMLTAARFSLLGLILVGLGNMWLDGAEEAYFDLERGSCICSAQFEWVWVIIFVSVGM